VRLACQPVLERFDDAARSAIEGAYRAAREMEHGQVGTEHLLLGILGGVDNRASEALAACGATLEGCRVKVVEAVAGKRPGTPALELTLTDRANLALDRAGRLSLRQRCDHVEARHILLSVLNVEGTAGQVLRGLSVDPDCVRQRLTSGSEAIPGTEHVKPGGDQSDVIQLRCPRCGLNLDSTLTHRLVSSRAEEGTAIQFLVAYCSMCGRAISASPA
jgi:ATP-dependent Clp protease ATP-binding subunit ClpA